MRNVDWKKVGTVGAVAATAVGTVVGMSLAPDTADQVSVWTEAARNALTAVTAIAVAFGAAVVGARRK